MARIIVTLPGQMCHFGLHMDIQGFIWLNNLSSGTHHQSVTGKSSVCPY